MIAQVPLVGIGGREFGLVVGVAAGRAWSREAAWFYGIDAAEVAAEDGRDRGVDPA